MLDQEAIKKIIPHRDPFLLIDQVTELVDLKFARGVKYVKPDEDYFRGHFPNEPVMPGVLILEAMAQVGAVIVLSDEKFRNKTAFFVSADNVRFRKKVLPGDKLEIEIELTKIRLNFGVGQGKAYVNGELVCEGTIKFAIE